MQVEKISKIGLCYFVLNYCKPFTEKETSVKVNDSFIASGNTTISNIQVGIVTENFVTQASENGK